MKLTIGAATDPGQKRGGSNQDAIGVFRSSRPVTSFDKLLHPTTLLILADGMGGHAGGRTASNLVVEDLRRSYESARRGRGSLAILKEAVQEALAAVQARAAQEPPLADMGSTVAAVLLEGRRAALVNVGDSRVYWVGGEKLHQVSYDHSLVAELVRAGAITSAEALAHPRRNQLTQSITAQRRTVEPFAREVELIPGDRVLLCSDGLWGVVPEEQILHYVLNFTPQTAADDLVKQALEYGGPDNISVILAGAGL